MEKTTETTCGIAGMGFYLPEKEISVRELAEQAGIPEVVAVNAGAETVREAAAGELPSDMAIAAAKTALRDAGIPGGELDLIIYCGAGLPDYIIPQTSGRIQHALGASHAFAFDLVQNCSGMITALQTAKGFIALDEGINTALLVAGDKWSRFTRFHAADSVFFGDGGGAVVVKKGAPDFEPQAFHSTTDGAFYDLWRIEAGGVRHPATAETVASGLHIYDCMDKDRAHHEFRDIYIPVMVKTVKKVLQKKGISAGEVAYFDMVNANLRVTEIVLDTLKIPREKSSIPYLKRYGHFGAHDIFFNLQCALDDGRLEKGAFIVLQSTGVGFTWAAAVLRY